MCGSRTPRRLRFGPLRIIKRIAVLPQGVILHDITPSPLWVVRRKLGLSRANRGTPSGASVPWRFKLICITGTWKDPVAGLEREPRVGPRDWRYGLEVDHSLEAAPDHALGIEGHRFGIHHLGKPLVLHHLRVDAVTSGARLVDDIGEHDGLAGLLLDAARERCSLSPLDVVGDAFAELQRAVLAPDLTRLGRHAPVGCKLLLRNRHDKSIDVAHGNAPLVEKSHDSAGQSHARSR